MQTSTYIGSVSGYLAAVRELTADSELILFRGQPNRRRALLPPIARNNRPISTAVERHMLAMFQQYGEFSPKGAAAGGDRVCDWHLLSQAQQFGMKTRLLAWSQNPLIALWFACQRGAAEPYVYLLRADGLDDVDFATDPLAISQTRVFSPLAARPEATAQRSWYSIHPALTTEAYPEAARGAGFVPLEQELHGRDRLLEIPLLPAMKSKLLADLATFGITERTVYPGLNGLCQHLNAWLTGESAGAGIGAAKSEPGEVSNPPHVMEGELRGCSGKLPKALAYRAVASALTGTISSGHPPSGLRQYRRQYTADFDFD
ncbi:FRG domain-containing protein [Photobacterium atrarenae]|uniref:FRG domain-containing protein n=1 Tax=Photobacterium atrarenae TaxID=865757 RepID=A0ABY5GBN4_9GAMM|nr:FRG domain-containing protein [Photobacterium atrarenae]UTV26603.1 FRG domain-containing protein [Photobacterium atrarenae]